MEINVQIEKDKIAFGFKSKMILPFLIAMANLHL
jgi:hypothetical protein